MSKLSLWLSPLFFETQSLVEPEAHQLSRLADQQAPGIFMSLPLHCQDTGTTQAYVPIFYMCAAD